MTVDQRELNSHPQLAVTGPDTATLIEKTNKQKNIAARNSQLWY